MGFSSDGDILRVRFQDEWALLHPDMQISWENVKFNPPNEAWARFTIKKGKQERISISDTVSANFQTTGLLMIEIFTLAGIGTKQGDDLVDEASNIFRGFLQGSVRCRAPEITFSGKNGKYWKNLIQVPFLSYEAHNVNI